MNVQPDPRDRERIEKVAREPGKHLRALVHEALESQERDGDSTSSDHAEAAWKAFLAATSQWSKNLPEGHLADDSRESIYAAGRMEREV